MNPKIWIRISRNVDGEKVYTPHLTFGVSSTMFFRECETLEEARWSCRIMVINLEGAGCKNIKYRKRPTRNFNCPIKR